MRIHLDTDLGSDTDDACALAMLLGWPDVEIVGITTSMPRSADESALMSKSSAEPRFCDSDGEKT